LENLLNLVRQIVIIVEQARVREARMGGSLTEQLSDQGRK